MQLTRFTDYSLRTLIYVGTQGGRLVTIDEISTHFGISRAHLVKVVHKLGQRGYLQTIRGRTGGIRLARPAEQIRAGEVVRDTEDGMAIAECFAGNQSCRLLPSCALKSAFAEARKSFLTTLDGYRLSDLLRPKQPAPKAAVAQLPEVMARNLKKLAKRGR